MSNINQYLKNIMKAIYGKEVRQSIHDAIKEIDKVADTAQNSATEMARAAQQAAAAAGQSEEAAGNSAAAAAVSKQEAGKSEVSAAESAAAALSNKNAAVAAAAGASASEQTAVQKAKEASVSAESAKGSEQAAGSAAQRAAEQSENASSKASEASVSAELAGRNADNASDAAVSAESYAHGGTGTRDREDVDNAKYYKEQAERISQGLAGGLLPMGTVIFSQLSQQTKHPGYMYNIADRFTTTEEFKEGAGHTYASGSNVYWTADGYWDCLAGTNVVKEDLDKKLGKTESTSNNIVNYDAGDNLSPTDWSEVAKLSSGETHKSLFQKMSLAVKNVRYLYKLFGSNDISDLGDGTASGAIKQLNTLLSQVDSRLGSSCHYTIRYDRQDYSLKTLINTLHEELKKLRSSTSFTATLQSGGEYGVSGYYSPDNGSGAYGAMQIIQYGSGVCKIWCADIYASEIKLSPEITVSALNPTVSNEGQKYTRVSLGGLLDIDNDPGICTILATSGSHFGFTDIGGNFVNIGALGFVTNSSRRYKENINPMPDSRAGKILDLDVVTYDYKQGQESGRYDRAGIIAEECVGVIPEAVIFKEIDGEKVPDGIDYTRLIPYLIKTAQPQQAQIRELYTLSQKCISTRCPDFD